MSKIREIKFRCWYDNQMHKVQDISFRHKTINLFGADIIKFEDGILMQYTGSKDKNGVDIYEGDIVKNNWTSFAGKDLGEIWEVRFGEYDNSDLEYGSGGNIGFYVYSLKSGSEEGLNNLPCNFNDGIEVIGNIYEDLKESGE